MMHEVYPKFPMQAAAGQQDEVIMRAALSSISYCSTHSDEFSTARSPDHTELKEMPAEHGEAE